ncbi:MAG: 8-oxo-dGTP diphosphatase MutT [Candidatus Marinimicrobia bacterium]|nr:8-oxo-dGTP diphosphatase MutT [Candidatus Neomarinimicrobiota bacterium]
MKSSLTAVVAGIIKHNGQYLITKRFENSHLGGMWEFPGGKIMKGESEKTALKRELKEEVGINCSIGELVYKTNYHYPDLSINIKFYQCKLLSGEPKPLECAAVKWIKSSKFSQYEFPPSDIKLIEMLSIG